MTEYQGFVEDLDETLYHSLPGLSSTGAKQILRSPAHYQHYINAEQKPKAEFDTGSLLHSDVLGVGAKVEFYPKDVLSKSGTTGTDAARAFAKEVRARGNIPYKEADYEPIKRMAASVRANDTARTLLEGGRPEVSMFADDPVTGVALRGRLDYLRQNAIVDVKTTARDASEEGFQGDVFDHGYHVQYGIYSMLYELITGEPAPPWLWVVVEKNAPYLTAVHTLGRDEMEMGRRDARAAIDRFAACTASGQWPGYTHRSGGAIGLIKAPAWAIYQHIDRYEGQ